ncbi:MAG: NUDIX domain-containing protein [Oscillospiraceae bacterium]|nr:NUDIX domain-containing protein [Oscillospiraceae bacterium]
MNYADLEGKRGIKGGVCGAYVVGVDRPLRTFDGRVIALLRRADGSSVFVLAHASQQLIETEIRAILDMYESKAPYTLDCKYECSCGAVAFHTMDDVTKFLLIKNKRSLHWSFPKGHMEAGERPEDTAVREVREETGVEIEIVPGFCETNTYDIQVWIQKKVVFFLAQAKTIDITKQAEEIDACSWLTFDDAISHLHFDKDKRILRGAKQFLRQKGLTKF